MRRESIHVLAQGRWRTILPRLGVHESFLSGRHGPCPICGGKDRYRWVDKDGSGGYICGQCGPGTGVDLVMKVGSLSFIEAVKLIEPLVNDAPVVMPKPDTSGGKHADELWASGSPLTGYDPAAKYLQRRGIRLPWPAALRYTMRATYLHEDGSRTVHPAMLARFVAPDRASATTHVTYLTETGEKADVPKAKKLAKAKVPPGGAVPLAPSAETMGIAEGLETALSAMLLFDVPVWAGLSDGGLMKWQPPTRAKNILVFGDNDASLAGQLAAFSLGHRLLRDGLLAEVRLPDLPGTDWNDVLLSEQVAA